VEPSSRRLLLAGLLVGLCGGFLLSKSLFNKTPTPIPVITAADTMPAAASAPGQEHAQDKVSELLDRARSDPKNREVRVELANISFDNGLYDFAIKFYQEAADLDPSDPDVHVDMGIAYRRLGKFDEAIAAFKQALAIAPDHALAWFNLALVEFADKHDSATAKGAAEKALELKPDLSGARLLLDKIRNSSE